MNNLDGILLKDIRWSVTTAGPSPYDNNRTELFLLGCQKAMSGNPCKKCFNSCTWDNSIAEFSHDPIIMAKIINKYAPNKYITIGGGEPTDQLKNLIILCRELKKYDFNIFVYTWRSIDKILNNDFQNIVPLKSAENFFADFKILLKYIDVIIDGEYVDSLRIYNENSNDGLTSSIGSSNQNICIIKNNILYKKYNMKNIKRIYYINNEIKIEEYNRW